MTASPELRQRAEALAAAITGNIPYDRYFAPEFRAAIPEATFRQVRDQLTGGLGKPTRLEALVARTPMSPTSASASSAERRSGRSWSTPRRRTW